MPYVADTLPVGPKFVPVRVTTVLPTVGIDEPPVDAEIAGGVYDTVPADCALACEPTVTIHVNEAPTPTTELHVIVVSATVTAHEVAVYPVPLGPYVALTLPGVGPKLVPVSVIVVPPAVGIDDPPATPPLTAGAV